MSGTERDRDERSGAVLVIAGPTASGKSAMAADAARAFDGVVINADSMQMYRDLRVLSARPGADAAADVPHRLYGVLDAGDVCSAGRWRSMALAEIADAHAQGSQPIVVGGTGLYLNALMGGISDVPPVPGDVRRAVRARLASEGPERLHEELARRDPAGAARLEPRDRQRIARALEVLDATGLPLSHWHDRTSGQGHTAGLRFIVCALLPDRQALYAACDERFRRMLAEGALDEVRRLLARRLDSGLPLMKALGVPPLAAHIRGELTLDDAVARAQRDTRRYAKRQMTWLRTQMVPDIVFSEQYSASLQDDFFSFISRMLLTNKT